MKKYLIVLLVCTVSLAQAQHKPFQFGIKVGGNLGWFGTSAEGYSSKDSPPGGSFGLLADFYIMENYSFTTGLEALYLNSKLKYPHVYNPPNGGAAVSGELLRFYKARYIQIPLLFTMKTNEIAKLRFFGQIGLGLGILVKATAEDEFTSKYGVTFEKETKDIYSEMNFYRTSFILGAGLEIPLHKSTHIRTGVKYDNCFLNVLKGDNAVDPSVENQALNHFFELYAAIIF